MLIATIRIDRLVQIFNPCSKLLLPQTVVATLETGENVTTARRTDNFGPLDSPVSVNVGTYYQPNYRKMNPRTLARVAFPGDFFDCKQWKPTGRPCGDDCRFRKGCPVLDRRRAIMAAVEETEHARAWMEQVEATWS